jgi:NarL family two-component system response regulator LiaR
MAKILIADDSELVRPMLIGALSERKDWTMCGEAANGRQAVLLAVELRPDVILLDFLMPMLSGLQAAEEILKIMPRVPIVLYTKYDNALLEAEAKKIGIRKIISKANSSKLAAALEEVLGKPHDIGPMGVSSEYKVEPVSGEGSVSIKARKPSKPGTD